MLLVTEAMVSKGFVPLESIEDKAVLVWCGCVAWMDVKDIAGVAVKFVDGQPGVRLLCFGQKFGIRDRLIRCGWWIFDGCLDGILVGTVMG